jgi:hypothetical protein
MTQLVLTTFGHTQDVHGHNLKSVSQEAFNGWLTAVSRQIEKYLSVAGLYQESRTQVLDVKPGQRKFILNTFPISSVTSVISSASRDFTVDAIDTELYNVDTERGILRLDSASAAPGWGTLQVIHTGGLDTTAANVVANYADIATACSMQIIHLMQKAPQFGSTTKGGAGGSVSYEASAQLLEAVKQNLEPYMRY